jgi:beta-1,4-mannosyltransferase
VGYLHFHWPQAYYSHRRPGRLQRPLSWAKVTLFAARLGFARALGYRIVWTIHEVRPHEAASGRLDRLGTSVLARLSNVLIAHDRGTVDVAFATLGRRAAARIHLVPHGSYIGIYQHRRSRADVRGDLEIPEDAFAFLCFGHIRGYKALGFLLRAFAAVSAPNAVLVIAGLVMDEDAAEEVRQAAERDPRIKLRLEFVPDEAVAELFGACDAAVLGRGDGGTSGALILALSLGLPVVAARTPVYEELLSGDSAGWLFESGEVASLAAALDEAAGDPADARTKGEKALEHARTLRWPEIGEQTARLLLVRADRTK